MQLVRVTDTSVECIRAIIPGHIYSTSPNAIFDLHTNAVYYAREHAYDRFRDTTNTVFHNGRTCTISVRYGLFSLVHNDGVVASVDVPDCRGNTCSRLEFCQSRENPWRVYIQLGFQRFVELELVPN